MTQPSPSSDIVAYRQQIFNFLGSLTLKYTPIIDAYNDLVLNAGYSVDQTDLTTWKYYLNITGQYHAYDKVMTIVSLDTRQTIVFNPQNLALHTRTAQAYQVGSSYYNELCQRYPDQVDLVKSIVYPVSDINFALQAEDFTVLAYGQGFLEPTEFSYLYDELLKAIAFITQRWDLRFLSYEPYFAITYWTMLWSLLAQALMTARIKAIKTVNVHSFHIWQYLTSKGLTDYSDILSRRQSLSLYRNIDYLVANRGKQTNLVLLAEILLKEINVGLYGRVVYQQTSSGADQCQLTPEFVPVSIPNLYAGAPADVPPSSMADINLRLVEAGLDIRSDTDYVSAQAVTLSSTVVNTYPTKLLEIRPLDYEKKYADFCNKFVIDSFVYMVCQGMYQTTLEINSFADGSTIELSVQEALALYYYAIRRTCYDPLIINLPTKYTSSTAFSLTPQTPSPTITFNATTYPTKGLVHQESYLGSQPYYSGQIYEIPHQVSEHISQLFLQALTMVIQSRKSASLPASFAMEYLTSTAVVQGDLSLNLIPSITTYAQWWQKRPDIYNGVVSIFEAQNQETLIASYTHLSDSLLTSLLPITSIMQQYGNFQISDSNYAKLKQLFIQMCSYNITFLDTDRNTTQFLYAVGGGIESSHTLTIGPIPAPASNDIEISPILTHFIEAPPSDLVFQDAPTLTQVGTLRTHQIIKGQTDIQSRVDVSLMFDVDVQSQSYQQFVFTPQGITEKTLTFTVTP